VKTIYYKLRDIAMESKCSTCGKLWDSKKGGYMDGTTLEIFCKKCDKREKPEPPAKLNKKLNSRPHRIATDRIGNEIDIMQPYKRSSLGTPMVNEKFVEKYGPEAHPSQEVTDYYNKKRK